MGVYIKDMEMPKCCAECKMYVEDIYCCHLLHREIENPWADDGVELDCPLVLVPPHGDLIDRDPFIEFIKTHWNSYGQWFVKQLKARPAIIPAEEGE